MARPLRDLIAGRGQDEATDSRGVHQLGSGSAGELDNPLGRNVTLIELFLIQNTITTAPKACSTIGLQT